MTTTRTTTDSTVTRVQHVAQPIGEQRENGLHLADLRAFVAAAEGLPDDAYVRVDKGHVDDDGRYQVTVELIHKHPAPTPAPKPVAP